MKDQKQALSSSHSLLHIVIPSVFIIPLLFRPLYVLSSVRFLLLLQISLLSFSSSYILSSSIFLSHFLFTIYTVVYSFPPSNLLSLVLLLSLYSFFLPPSSFLTPTPTSPTFNHDCFPNSYPFPFFLLIFIPIAAHPSRRQSRLM